MAQRIEIESFDFEGVLPKDAGKWEWNIATASPAIVYGLVLHALKRKVRDLVVDWHLKSEYKEFGGKRELRETDYVLPDQATYNKEYKAEVQNLFAEFAKGNFGFAGSGRTADPVGSEMWVILFKRAGVSGKEQSKAREKGKAGLAEQIIQTQLGAKRISTERMKQAVAAYLEKLKVQAQEIVDSRKGEESFDIDALIASAPQAK